VDLKPQCYHVRRDQLDERPEFSEFPVAPPCQQTASRSADYPAIAPTRRHTLPAGMRDVARSLGTRSRVHAETEARPHTDGVSAVTAMHAHSNCIHS